MITSAIQSFVRGVNKANGTTKTARPHKARKSRVKLELDCLESRFVLSTGVVVVGGLSNFDCTNGTGKTEDEFEIELPSVDPTEIASFWANTPTYKGSGYGLPTMGKGPSSDGIAGHTSTYVDYKTAGISTPAGFTEHFGIHFVNPTFMPPSTIYTWKSNGVPSDVPMPSVSLTTTPNAAGGATITPVVTNNTTVPLVVQFHTAVVTPVDAEGVQLGDLVDNNTDVLATEAEVEAGDNGNANTGVRLNPGEVLGVDGEAHETTDPIIVDPAAWLLAHPGEGIAFSRDLDNPGDSEMASLIVTDVNHNPIAQIFSAVNTLAAPTVTQITPLIGPTTGGTIVTITGTNFTGATSVTFGGIDAINFAVNSDTQITATSPAGNLGVVDVVVTTPSGSSAISSADNFTFSDPPMLISTVLNGNDPQLLGLPAQYVDQRSMVRSFQLTFDSPVSLDPGAVTIALDPGSNIVGVVPTILLSPATSGATYDTVWNVSFSGAGVTAGGSIADGKYILTVDPLGVSNANGQKLASAPAPVTFHRLFGDVDGDGTVNTAEIIGIRRVANTTSDTSGTDFLWCYDSDWNGTISTQDIIATRRNANKTI